MQKQKDLEMFVTRYFLIVCYIIPMHFDAEAKNVYYSKWP